MENEEYQNYTTLQKQSKTLSPTEIVKYELIYMRSIWVYIFR